LLVVTLANGLGFVAKVWLTKDLRKSVRNRHPWLYDKALRGPEIAAGSLVEVYWKKDLLACGFYDPHSPLRVRLLWWPGDRFKPDTERWAPALAQQAAALRHEMSSTGLRLLHGEADWMPGLVLDVYGSVGVCAFDGRGAEAFWRPRLASIIAAFSESGFPLTGVIRKDSEETLWGIAPSNSSVFQENGVSYEVDVWHGHKTGFFLDQRPNRYRLRELAKGKDVLDLFSYTGGFAVAAALGKARSTRAVDAAPKAIKACQRNYNLNGLEAEVCDLATATAKHSLHIADCWDFLTKANGKIEVDIVVLDPPSMAPRAAARREALKAYETLNEGALRLLRPGGRLISCSCSSHITRKDLLQVAQVAAQRTGRKVRLEEEGGAGSDHPVRRSFPEGNYLQVLHWTVE